jgi:Asp-tRNA(Asn)/Glu-tRNA(Gln) amidotransferase A subunit family amidase
VRRREQRRERRIIAYRIGYATDGVRRPFDMVGAPTIFVPCGFTQSGLPIGMQITGALGDEGTVLRLARAYEQATERHKHGSILEQKA